MVVFDLEQPPTVENPFGSHLARKCVTIKGSANSWITLLITKDKMRCNQMIKILVKLHDEGKILGKVWIDERGMTSGNHGIDMGKIKSDGSRAADAIKQHMMSRQNKVAVNGRCAFFCMQNIA